MNKPIVYRLLQLLSLVPLLAWPLVVYLFSFWLKDPDTPLLKRIVAYLVYAYPLFFIANVLISDRLYTKRRGLAIGLLVGQVLLAAVFYFELL